MTEPVKTACDSPLLPPRVPGAPLLLPIEPRYIWVMRAGLAINMLFVMIALAVLAMFLHQRFSLSLIGALFPALLAAALILWIWPARRIASWSYHLSEDHLRTAHGFLFRTDTIVPFVRVQHIDVKQGPLERALGLSRLVVHTSGVLNQAVVLPGLESDLAAAMRETIHRHILTDFE